jgi:monofunctional biosynthetic peptidoglycan transglycosylase
VGLVRKLLLGSAAATALFVLWLFAVWPPPVWYRTHFPAATAFMRMREGNGPAAHRLATPVPLDSVAPAFLQAVLISEDNRFWTHGGIDFVEFRRALGYRRRDFSWRSAGDLLELVRASGRAWERRDALRGASTLTQQLAKNLYLSPSRNPLRKVKEAVTAYRLESALGKRRILELYVNVVELGEGVWGVEAASRRYYDRPAAQLSRRQAAALAAALPFPLLANPDLRPGRLRWRQTLILARMGGRRVEVPRQPEPVAVEPIPAESVPPPELPVAEADGGDLPALPAAEPDPLPR